jgi:hypothetical protein
LSSPPAPFDLPAAQGLSGLPDHQWDRRLSLLVAGAHQGIADACAELCVLALQDSPRGVQAEQALFDCSFTRLDVQTPGSYQIRCELLRLYGEYLDDQLTREFLPLVKFDQASALLVVVGFAAAERGWNVMAQQIHEQLKPRFRSAQSEREDVAIRESLFSANRCLTHDEIAAVAARLQLTQVRDPALVSINRPLPMETPGDLDLLLHNLQQKLAPGQTGLAGMEIFPLVADKHWLLMVLSQKPTYGKRLCFFSATPAPFAPQLTALVDALGLDDDAVILIEADLQRHSPNACGVFVCHAAALLLTDCPQDDFNPLRTLISLIRNYNGYSPEGQACFNLRAREEILAALFATGWRW